VSSIPVSEHPFNDYDRNVLRYIGKQFEPTISINEVKAKEVSRPKFQETDYEIQRERKEAAPAEKIQKNIKPTKYLLK
jgi:hypothetical protein